MSLILETLKKLRREKKEDKEYLPPNLKKQGKENRHSFSKNNKKIFVLTGLLLITGILILTLIQYLNLKLSENTNMIAYNYKNPLNITGDQKVSKTELKPMIKEKATTVRSQNNQKMEKNETGSKIEKLNKKELEKKEQVNLKKSKLANKVQKNKITELPPPALSGMEHKRNKEKQMSKGEIWRHINLANEYVKSGELEKAIKEYYLVIKYKKDEKIINNLIYLLIKTNKIKDLDKLIKKYNLFKNRKVFIKTVILLLNARKFNFAMKIIKLYGHHIEKYIYLYLKGLYYEKIGNIDKAIEFYKMAYEKNPLDDLIAYSYGRLLDIKGNFDKALSIYKRLYKNTKNIKLKNIVEDRINKLEAWYYE